MPSGVAGACAQVLADGRLNKCGADGHGCTSVQRDCGSGERYLLRLCQGCSRVYSKVTGISSCVGSYCVVRVGWRALPGVGRMNQR